MKSPAPKINPLERLILLSADEAGRIPFFKWQAMGVDGNLKALSLMERAGYLSREPGDKFCRAFHLTDAGKQMRARIQARLEEIHTVPRQSGASVPMGCNEYMMSHECYESASGAEGTKEKKIHGAGEKIAAGGIASVGIKKTDSGLNPRSA